MKNKKETKKTKDDLNSTPWLGNKQKLALSNVFGGFIIAGGLVLLNYLFGKSDITVADALFIAIGTMIAVAFLLWLQKE